MNSFTVLGDQRLAGQQTIITCSRLPAENLSLREDGSVRPTQHGVCLKADQLVRLIVVISHYNPLDNFTSCSCKGYYLKGSGGKTARQKSLGKPKRRWKSNIKKCHLVKAGSGVNWIFLAQDRDKCWALVNAVMNLWFVLNAGKFLTGCRKNSFSRRTLPRGVSQLICLFVWLLSLNQILTTP